MKKREVFSRDLNQLSWRREVGACVCRGGGGGAQTVTVEVSVQSGEVWVEHVLTPPPPKKDPFEN